MKIELNDRQIETIKSALRLDIKEVRTHFGALPIGQELEADIQDAYQAIINGERKSP